MSKKQQGQNSIVITSGIYRGETILTPGGNTHPMGSRERIALFNMIQSDLPGAIVLDIYAGSGALGIEALSRGAAFVTFVDNNRKAIETIRQNLEKLNETRNKLICEDALKGMTTVEEEYSIVLADPPYDKYQPEMVTKMAHLVTRGGILVISTPVNPPEIKGLELIKAHKYARAYISVYRRCN